MKIPQNLTPDQVEARSIDLAWMADNTTDDSETVWKRQTDEQKASWRTRAKMAS